MSLYKQGIKGYREYPFKGVSLYPLVVCLPYKQGKREGPLHKKEKKGYFLFWYAKKGKEGTQGYDTLFWYPFCVPYPLSKILTRRLPVSLGSINLLLFSLLFSLLFYFLKESIPSFLLPILFLGSLNLLF